MTEFKRLFWVLNCKIASLEEWIFPFHQYFEETFGMILAQAMRRFERSFLAIALALALVENVVWPIQYMH